MNRTSLISAAAVVALGVGLVYVSARAPVDAPTLATTAEAVREVKTPPAVEEPKTVVNRPPSHTAFINIPRLGVEEDVSMELDAGPAFWPVTGRPGGGDTIAIAGHRTTHTAPFLRLDELQPGDRIYVRYQGEVHAYEVKLWRVEPATNLHIADAVGYERLLLTACATADGSPTSLAYRIVVHARPL